MISFLVNYCVYRVHCTCKRDLNTDNHLRQINLKVSNDLWLYLHYRCNWSESIAPIYGCQWFERIRNLTNSNSNTLDKLKRIFGIGFWNKQKYFYRRKYVKRCLIETEMKRQLFQKPLFIDTDWLMWWQMDRIECLHFAPLQWTP